MPDASDDRPRAYAFPRVFTVAATRPFLTVLAEALVAGRIVPGFHAGDPLALAGATILVPTRRAARALQEAFVRAGGKNGVALVPRIRPIGDIDEDLIELDRAVLAEDITAMPATPMSDDARVLVLARLVMGWRERLAGAVLNPLTGQAPGLPGSPAEAIHLARALMTLMDQVTTQQADWTALAGLAPGDHAKFWDLSVAFLKIVTEFWPAYLAEQGLEDPAARRDRLIRAEAARLASHPPDGPFIVAGSTGSVPATAELMRVVARLPNGAVVLPGLDKGLDDDSWDAIGTLVDAHAAVGHPQFGLKALLETLEIPRDQVVDLDPEPDPALVARMALASEAMRPAATTDRWATLDPTTLGPALAGLAVIEARGEVEEGAAIALALREAVERPGTTAALVTPDRNLARRVSLELQRFGLDIDDSAGRPLSATASARLAGLVADVALGSATPIDILALLHHPAALFGLAPEAAREAARTVELLALRGPQAGPGIAGLSAAFEAASADRDTGYTPLPRRRLSDPAVDRGRDLIARLAAALKPFADLGAAGSLPLEAFLAAHCTAVAAVASDPDGVETGLLADEGGSALATTMLGLEEAARQVGIAPEMTGREYPAVFAALIGVRPVRKPGGPEARIHIWGPLESRLLRVDRLVLAGLNEGTWPASARTDPWLSRPMKRALGLEAPERRVGLAAHDIAQGLGLPEVVLSRTLKSGGAPTVPSRWLQRLKAVIGPDLSQDLVRRGETWLGWARRLDRRGDLIARPVARPAPKPPVDLRPTSLSVTEIERWFRDPYALYARHILRLDVLEPIGASPDARERGTIVHGVMSDFIREATTVADLGDLPRFMAIAERHLAPLAPFPGVVALWRARLAGIGRWFTGEEPGRPVPFGNRHVEIGGKLRLDLADSAFTLRGRADRIDIGPDGRVTVVDYKTGSPPSDKQVGLLFSPQLPLEAAMARAGVFGGPDTKDREVAALVYVKLTGDRRGGEWRVVKPNRDKTPIPLDELMDSALTKLVGLAARYRDPEQPYASRPRIAFESRIDGDYDHLARVAEWSAGLTGDGEGGE